MLRDHVPGRDDRLFVLGTQDAERARMRVPEQAGGGRVEAEPARSEDALQVPVPDEGDVAVVQQRPHPVQYRVDAGRHLLERLTPEDTVAPQVPAGLVAAICASVRLSYPP